MNKTREAYHKEVNRVVEYINNHLDSPLELTVLAEISNVSPYHFHRVFKAIFGEPIGFYVMRIRIETAAKLIRYTTLPIEEIAYKVGYDIPSSLSKAFKKFYGISPTDYRTKPEYKIMKQTFETKDAFKLKKPKILEFPEKNAIYLRMKGEYSQLDYGTAWQKLWQHVKEDKLFTAGIEHIGIGHDNPQVTDVNNCRYDACLVIHKETTARGEIGLKTIAGGKYAVFLIQGPYTNLGLAYDQIFNGWLMDSEYQLRDEPAFEKYISHPDRVAPEKLKTEIYVPIK